MSGLLGCPVADTTSSNKYLGKEMFEIFKLFFTDEIISHLTEQTNLYAHRDKNNKDFCVDENDMMKFLGLLLISGYHSVPSENDYWSSSEDLEIPIFAKTMCRERFKSIKRYFHVADNNNLENLKVAKILPLLHMLRNNCQKHGIFHEFLSIDESMIPYRGHHSAKQFIRNKPVRFGYKMWMMCSADGYPYNFSIYCGKDKSKKELLGYQVVMDMLQPVMNKDEHVVFFDNFFTSHALMIDLTSNGFRACGTIRDNRTGKCPLLSKKELEKKERGSYDYRSDDSVLCSRWNDNSIVTVASNYYGVSPMQKVNRWVKNEGRKAINQPHMIKMYNKGMGGVDVCDQMLSTYRPRLRSKKWWWNIWSHLLNLSIAASFRFYQHVNPGSQISHKDFRREIARTLARIETPRKREGGPTSSVPKAIRYDNVNHFLQEFSQGRCYVCKKNTRLKCIKCEKRLHKACSINFHKK
ncbi:piggyBac transposable element-derived protein 3-like [Homarus americanus]|uniref:piggyBac transposable element-derived protein 3-like n=1 Tax=Homarus americanus TaxID=6706 RepID=UPI001C469AE0|nr:piggyBac transposable element-derived protein 3-like [Homarus americanus]